MFDSDLNIFYLGGSGGFYLLHCLLLKKQHFCWFPYQSDGDHQTQLRLDQFDYENIKDSSWPKYEQYLELGNQGNQELIDAEIKWPGQHPGTILNQFDRQFELAHQHNWNPGVQEWKAREVWPSNERTLQSDCSVRPYRIFFVCNDIEKWLQFPGKKLMLYTDVRTQIRLSMYKKAWQFGSSENVIAKTRATMKHAKNYKGTMVSGTVFDALALADYPIKLQEFVGDMLSEPVDSAQHKFTQQWLSFHPASLLRKCSLG